MQKKIERIFFLDSMRAILMMLGVVIHSAQVYNPKQVWLVFSNETTIFSTYLIDIIHTFRMPAFFVISGYFCFLTLKKYRPKLFLRVRLKRLFVPFLVTALSLNSLQAFILHKTGWQPFHLKSYLLNGDYISHLWFLINIMVYFIVASTLAALFPRALEKAGRILSGLISKLPLIMTILLMPMCFIFTVSVNKVGLPIHHHILGIVTLHSLLQYAPFFIFGIIIALDQRLLDRICAFNPLFSITAAIGCSIAAKQLESNSHLLASFGFYYLGDIARWFSVMACFSIFYTYLNKPSKTFFFLADASYTVYLFHHVLVISLAIALMPLPIPPILGIFTLIAIISLVTLCIHRFLISKNDLLLFFFNGKEKSSSITSAYSKKKLDKPVTT